MIVFDSIISVSSNSGGGGGGSSGILAASEYIIPTFLAMIFAAARCFPLGLKFHTPWD